MPAPQVAPATRRPSNAQPYVAASVAVVLAAAVRIAMAAPTHDAYPFASFLIAVIVVTWRFGARAGLLTTALSLPVGIWSIAPPLGTLSLSGPAGILRAVLFACISGAVVAVSEAQHRSRRQAEASERARRQVQERLEFLAECSRTLASSLDYETTLANLARLLVPRLGDWCAIDMLEDDGRLRQVALAHPDPARIAWARSLPHRPPNWDSPHGLYGVLRTGEPRLYRELPEELLREIARDEPELDALRQIALRSAMVVPLRSQDRTIGAITLALSETASHYTESDLRYVEELARYAGMAVANARLYRAVQESDQRKDDFLAMLAHELRNPLAPIVTSLELLRRHLPDQPSARRQREVIERQVRQLSRLTDDLLDVSRLTRGKLRLRREPLDFAELVRTTAEDHRGLLEAAGLSLTVAVPNAALPIDGDPARLSQVVGNLLQNACKFTPSGGEVCVSLQGSDSEATLRVRDTGIGMSPELLPRVFESFVQEDRSLDRTRGGLGVGLALVKGLVELHGGAVSAQSPGLDRGSEFVATLPLSTAPAKVAPPAPPLPPAGSLSILIVEDNVDTGEMMRDLLELSGHRVEIALNGFDGVAAAKRVRPDLVLCDIGLPGMDGYAVARALRGDPVTRQVRLVAVSGYAAEEDRRRALEAGFDRHMAKPVSPADLQGVLADAAAGGPAGREAAAT